MNVQKLVIGTANFGSRYGISSERDLSRDVIDEMLEWASGKIDELDTSEDYIGSHKAISKHANNFSITSKIDLNQITSVKEISTKISKIKNELESQTIHRILVRPNKKSDLFTTSSIEELRVLQNDYNIREIGLSIYETRELEYYINELDGPLTFQIPLNILNRSFEHFVKDNLAANENFKFYARSIFLQGLLLMDVRKIPASLGDIIPILLALNENLRENGTSVLEGTFSYIKSQEWVSGVVVGISSFLELKKNLDVFQNSNPIDFDFIENIAAPPPRILDPRLW